MEASAVSSTRDVPEATPADTGGTSGSGAAGESAAEGGAALPTDAELRDAVRRYITQHAAQLEALTRKDVMKFLASTFGTDVTSKKAQVKILLQEIVQEVAAAAADSGAEGGGAASDDGKPAKRARAKGAGGYHAELELSPALADVLGRTHMTRSDATKAVWAYIKENNLPKAKGGKSRYMLDEKLSAALGRKTINFSTMSKALGAQLFDRRFSVQEASEAEEDAPSEDEAPPEAPKARKRKRAAAASKAKKPKGGASGASASGGAGNSGMNKPKVLSRALAAVVGAGPMGRMTVTKQLWHYVKSNGLQDGREWKLDDNLRAVFGAEGRTSISFFTAMKKEFLGRHLADVGEVPAADQ